MNGSADDTLDLRRRRLVFRAWHRGIRETDLILGRFADVEAGRFDANDMDAFELLLDVPDRDLLAWVTGAAPIPAEDDTPMLARVIRFHGIGR